MFCSFVNYHVNASLLCAVHCFEDSCLSFPFGDVSGAVQLESEKKRNCYKPFLTKKTRNYRVVETPFQLAKTKQVGVKVTKVKAALYYH